MYKYLYIIIYNNNNNKNPLLINGKKCRDRQNETIDLV